MTNGIYRAAVALAGHERRLDTIAMNLANLETSGYKRTGSAAHEFLVDGQFGEPVRGLRLDSKVDFSQGNLERTGRPLDLALFGDGFFAVEGPAGEVYTRSGSFRLDPLGEIVTDEGFPVAWRNKHAVADPGGLPVIVNGEGFVRQGSTELGQLQITSFKDNGVLRQGDHGFWTAPRRAPRATTTAVVHQFSLEESNANGMDEVIAMIGVQRSFGAISNLMNSMQRSYSRLTRSA